MAEVKDTYYPANAIHGYGTQWWIGQLSPGSPEIFSAVANVKRITPGDMTTEVLDRTHLRSPDAHREKTAGLRDSGAFEIECIYDPKHESHSNAGGGTGAFQGGGIFKMWRERQSRNMKLILADGSPPTTLPFRGIITRCQIGEMGEDAVIPLMVEVTPLQAYDAALP